jgi:hypothetical protein
MTNPAPAQPVPYYLQASSELSREFFLTDNVAIYSGDQVLPFVNPKNGNAVEALVFSGGTLSHLRRDPTAATGWSFGGFNLQGVFSSVNDIALAANGTDVYVLIFGSGGDVNDNPAGAPAWLTNLTGPATWAEGELITYDQLEIDGSAEVGTVKGGISREGSCYFYTTFVEGGTTTFGGWVATGSDTFDALAYQQYLQLDTSVNTVEDFVILYDTGTSHPANPTGFAVVLLSNGDLNVYRQDGEAFDTDPMTDAGAANVTELMWAWASPVSTTHIPGYAFQTSSGTVFADEFGNVNTVADLALKASNAVTVWQQNGLYTVNLLDHDGTLQMIQETSSSGTGSWATPLPLVPDLAAIFGVPTDPAEATLFAVDLSGYLNVLSLGPAGWTQTQVHAPGEEKYDFAAYRVQASVLDTDGTAVPGAQVVITTDRPVGCWAPAGNIPITPDSPATVTADVKGEITFSIPAQELDCAILVMQAHDANGNPTGDAFAVTPDTDVRGFLGGGGTLTDLGALSNNALLNTTPQNGRTSPFTGLTKLAPGDQQQAATASIQALGQLVKVGNDASNHTTTATAFTLDLSSGQPKLSGSASSAEPEGELLTLSFDHFFDSVGHALRHGAMALKTAVVKLAEDGVSWVVGLTVEIAGAIVTFADQTITDMKDAFHVIGGFFSVLGTDIKSAVTWLMHDIVALLKDAQVNAGLLQTWIGQLGGEVTDALGQVKIDTDNWFFNKKQQVTDALNYAMQHAEGNLGGPPLPAPSNGAGSTTSQNNLLKDLGEIGKVMNDVPGKWLLDKFLSYLPVVDPGPTIDQSTYEPLLQQLAKDWVDGMTFSEALFTFIKTTMSDGFSSNGAANKGALSNTQVTTWFEDLDNTVVDGLQLLDDVADTLLDIATTGVALTEAYFTYQYNSVASMGILGIILGEAGVDLKFSLDEIVSWVVAFPATLIGNILGYSTLFPSTEQAAVAPGQPRASLGKDPDGWQVGLGIIGAVTQGIWGFADLVGDLQQFYDSDTGKRGTPSGVIDYFDILCPLVETIALWPSEPVNNQASYPFHGGVATSTTDWVLLPFIIWTAVIPSVFGAVAKAGWTSDLSNSGFPSGVQDIATDYLGPFIYMIAGTANTIMGSYYSAKNSAGWVAIFGTVLGNLSFVGAPLATKVMNATTDDISTLVKMAIDAGGNIGAAVCIAEAASLPTP